MPKLVRARVSRPRRSTDRRSPGDAPTIGDWETRGRRGRAGQQETLPEPALKSNTVELAVRYVWNMASNYSPLTKGGYRGVPGRGDPAGLGRKITPPTPPSQGGDEFAISTATVGYN